MSRKYRQPGYQDRRDDRDDLFRAREERMGPRGRATPVSNERVFRCHLCGERILNVGTPLKGDVCEKCNAVVWCCKNCSFFDPGARYECRKPIPERIAKKDQLNECEHFSPRLVLDLGRKKTAQEPDTAKSLFDALFKDDK